MRYKRLRWYSAGFVLKSNVVRTEWTISTSCPTDIVHPFLWQLIRNPSLAERSSHLYRIRLSHALLFVVCRLVVGSLECGVCGRVTIGLYSFCIFGGACSRFKAMNTGGWFFVLRVASVSSTGFGSFLVHGRSGSHSLKDRQMSH